MKLRWMSAVLIASVLAPAGFAHQKNSDDRQPVAWGVLDGNSGCVIFREHRKVRGMFWGVAVTAKVSEELDVVQSENYTLPQAKYDENQSSMNELQRLAMKHNLKYVKIPGKVTPQALREAQTMCGTDSVPRGEQQ